MPSFDSLDELLERGDRVPELPANLKIRIRARMAARSTGRATWLERLDAVFARPSFAAVFVAACVLLGLFLAEARLTRWHAERGVQLARSYLQSIDPLIAEPAAEGKQ